MLEKVCRFCLEIMNTGEKIQLDRDLEDQFTDLTQMKLKQSTKISQIICKICQFELHKSLSFKNKLIEKQIELNSSLEGYDKDNKLHPNPIKQELTENIHEFESIDIKMEALEPSDNLIDPKFHCLIEEDQESEVPKTHAKSSVAQLNSKRSTQTSLETRKRIISEYQNGRSAGQISVLLNIKRTTCHEIIKRFKETGQIEVQRKGSSRAKIKEKEKEKIQQWIAADPDITTKMIINKCKREFGIEVGKTTIGRLMKDFGCVLKRDYMYTQQNDRSPESKEAGSSKSLEDTNKTKPVKDQETVLCPECGGFFKNRSLELHMLRKHVMQKNYSCDICGYRNYTKRHLRLHMANHSTQRRFKCPECDSRFAIPSIVRNHIKSVHRKNEMTPKFKCQYCEKSFKLKCVLIDHTKKVHLKQAEFVCDYPNCDESFIYKEAFRTHYERHEKATIPCDECGKMFHSERKMKEHKIRHVKTKNCEFCSKSFVTEKELNFHQKTVHEGIRNFVCQYCNNRYYRKNHLTRHILEQHLNMKIYCEVESCNSQFSRKTNYKKHILTHHKNLGEERIQKILLNVRNLKVDLNLKESNSIN